MYIIIHTYISLGANHFEVRGGEVGYGTFQKKNLHEKSTQIFLPEDQ